MTRGPVDSSDAGLHALAQQVGSLLAGHKQTVTTAESCTGGWIAKCLTDIAGSSAWFGSGFVTYSNQAKKRLVGVPDELITEYGAVSEPVVRAMAEGARRSAGADIAVAVSGIAGPDGGHPGKPVGTVWLAWARATGSDSRCVHFAGDREAVRRQTVALALAELAAGLAAAPGPG